MGVLAAAISPAAAFARMPDTRPRETAALERAKTKADRGLPPPSPRRAAAVPRTQLFNNTVLFDGAASLENKDWASYTPPDPTGSVGPANYVEIVNSMIEVFDKAGHIVSEPTDLQSFLIQNGLGLTPGVDHDNPGDLIFDVQVQWDEASQHWLLASVDQEASGTAPNHLVFGWSETDDPTGNWCVWRTDGTTTFDDYPKLGHDDQHLMIGTNEFADNSPVSRFNQGNLWVIQAPLPTDATCPASQPPMVGGGPQTVSGGFTPVPVNIADGGATGYVVATTGAGTSSLLRLYTVDGTTGLIDSGTSIAVNAFSAPPDVQQPGTTAPLDSQDGRLTQAVSVGDRIWTQHTVRSADGQRAEVRWYELDPTAVDKLVQEGSAADPSNSVFNAAISPAADGTHAAIHYNVGGRFHLVELRAQTRDGSTPPGQMENELTIDASSAIDQDFSCAEGPHCRWGDYAGASPDPATGSEGIVWGTNQLNGHPIQGGNAPSWVTRNFAVQFAPNDQPFTASVDGFPFTSTTPAPAFNFAASRTGSTFQCSLNGGVFAPCTPGRPFGPALANGTYTFAVFATDPAGQQSAPAQGTFTVAAPLPDTVIDSGPPASGTSRTATISFHSTKAPATFQCSLDGGAFTACTSPFTRAHMSPAQHAFAVRAIDSLANVDPTPAITSFKVALAPASASVRSQRASKKGTVSVRVRCPASREVACRGSVTLTSRGTLAKTSFRVASGRTATVHVKLRSSARKLLQRRKRLTVKATMRFSSPSKRTTKTFSLRRS